jgi:hypothetical protein
MVNTRAEYRGAGGAGGPGGRAGGITHGPKQRRNNRNDNAEGRRANRRCSTLDPSTKRRGIHPRDSTQTCRARATPMTIISVGVNETAVGGGSRKSRGGEEGRWSAGWRRRREGACASSLPPSFSRLSEGLINGGADRRVRRLPVPPSPTLQPSTFALSAGHLAPLPSRPPAIPLTSPLPRSLLPPPPALAFPFLLPRTFPPRRAPNLPSLPPRARPHREGAAPDRSLPSRQSRRSPSVFLPCRSVSPPFDTRRSHCSRVSRLAEVKPSDDFLAGTWFRARFPLFSSPPLLPPTPVHRVRVPPRTSRSPFVLLFAFIRGRCYTDDRSKGTHDRRLVTARRTAAEREADFRGDRCHCQWRERRGGRLTRV